MESPSRPRNSISIWTLCIHNWIAITLSAGFLLGWHFGVTRQISISAALFFPILCVSCYLAGALFLRVLPLSCFPPANYPLAFLLGFFLIGFTLFLLALVSPFGVKTNLIAVVLGIAAWATAARVPRPDLHAAMSLPPGSVSVVISLVAATLWAQDSIQPVTLAAVDPMLVHWPDSFHHARLISMFANQSLGAPIQSISTAGEPAKYYHYASYMLPAALSALTATPAYDTFGSFMMPTGIFLTGLAAYGIGKAFWGESGGVAATVALLLLPDAAQQGIHNYWYSYHFLQQVNPGQPLGVAILAVAWVYMFDACTTGRVASWGASYLLAAISIGYKAHFFVANAFLLWVFPALFFGALSAKKRTLWIALCVVSYWLTLKLAERVPGVPSIDLDGRGLLWTSKWIVQNFDSASIRAFLVQFLPQATDSRLYSLVWIAAMAAILFVITFGLFGPLYFALAWRLRKATSRMVMLFPLFVMIVYMFMSVGLTTNREGYYPDELTHRPFAWAYFVVCTWVGGAAWRIASNSFPNRSWQGAALAVVPLLFFVPWTFGKAIQVGPTRLWSEYQSLWGVPGGLVKAAYYVRDHSHAADIVQDSQGDARLILSGVAERQPYSLWNSNPARMPQVNQDRFTEITRFKNLTTQKDIVETARRYRIRWFVVHPDDVLGWPRTVIDDAVFESDGYRVYKFAS